jgi:hypothetical protein
VTKTEPGRIGSPPVAATAQRDPRRVVLAGAAEQRVSSRWDTVVRAGVLVVRQDRSQVEYLVDQVGDDPGQVVWGQPVVQRRGQQQDLVMMVPWCVGGV